MADLQTPSMVTDAWLTRCITILIFYFLSFFADSIYAKVEKSLLFCKAFFDIFSGSFAHYGGYFFQCCFFMRATLLNVFRRAALRFSPIPGILSRAEAT